MEKVRFTDGSGWYGIVVDILGGAAWDHGTVVVLTPDKPTSDTAEVENFVKSCQENHTDPIKEHPAHFGCSFCLPEELEHCEFIQDITQTTKVEPEEKVFTDLGVGMEEYNQYVDEFEKEVIKEIGKERFERV